MQLVIAHESPKMQLVCSLLQLGYLCGVLFILLLFFFKPALPFLHKKAVVPGIEFCFSIHNLNTALCYLVEEVAVVGNRQDCPAKA